MKTLVWTRPLSDWPGDEALLQGVAQKAKILRLPCLEIRPLPLGKIEERYDAFVFTSSKAAEIALANLKLARIAAGTAVYTHGPSTARTLEALGLKPEIAPVRTAEELGQWLISKIVKGSTVAWPRAEDPAYDLEGALNKAGLLATSLVSYRTEPKTMDDTGKMLTRARADELISTLHGAACFASPSSVTGFVQGLNPRSNRLGKELVAVCLGPTTEKSAREHFAQVRVAAANGIEAMIEAAATVL